MCVSHTAYWTKDIINTASPDDPTIHSGGLHRIPRGGHIVHESGKTGPQDQGASEDIRQVLHLGPGDREQSDPFHIDDIDGVLENIVFNELIHRYGTVAVYGVDRHEVDFIADPMGTPSYYQASMNISDVNTMEREIRPPPRRRSMTTIPRPSPHTTAPSWMISMASKSSD